MPSLTRFPPILLLLAALLGAAMGQNPEAPAAKAQSATGKWLAEQVPQWQAAYQREVLDVFDKANGELKKQYVAVLEAQIATAAKDARLDDAVAFRAERDRVASEPEFAMGDDLPVLTALKSQRTAIAANLAGLKADRAGRAKAVHARYDAIPAAEPKCSHAAPAPGRGSRDQSAARTDQFPVA